jgi:hypothetical protein
LVLPILLAAALAGQLQTPPSPCPDPVLHAAVRDPAWDRFRVDELIAGAAPRGLPRRGAAGLSTGRCPAPPGAAAPLFAAAPISVRATRNSEYPRPGSGDGVLWAGRGASALVEGGITLAYRGIGVTVRPAFAYQQNLDFERPVIAVPGFSEFVNPAHPTDIDLPLRHGAGSFETVHPGESMIRLAGAGLVGGVSTQTVRWGPARWNPIVLSAAGPGFPHVFVGTDGAARLPGVDGELELIVGRLDESPYFDGDPANDRRLLAALFASVRPDLLTGLELGIVHAQVEPWDQEEEPEATDLGALERMQLGAVFARWVLPASHAEVYGEWARRDLWADLFGGRLRGGDLGFTLGVQKAWAVGERWVRLHGEATSLRTADALRDGRVRSFYVHSRVGQGWTHRGRPLGAAIGPGSDAQALGVDLLRGAGSVGLRIERTRFDDEAYARNWAPWYTYKGHDVEVAVVVPIAIVRGGIRLHAEASLAHRWNRHFTGFDRITQRRRSEDNFGLQLEASWRP